MGRRGEEVRLRVDQRDLDFSLSRANCPDWKFGRETQSRRAAWAISLCRLEFVLAPTWYTRACVGLGHLKDVRGVTGPVGWGEMIRAECITYMAVKMIRQLGPC